MKRGLFSVLFFLVVLSSCKKEKDPAPQATSQNMAGYWKLARILVEDKEWSFSQYKFPFYNFAGVENMFYSLQSNGEASLVVEIEIYSYEYRGKWEIANNEVTATLDKGSLNYKVSSFGDDEIRLREANSSYELVFERINEQNFPEIFMSAAVNGTQFDTDDVQTLRQDGTLRLLGWDSQTDHMAIVFAHPEALVAGQSYVIDGFDIEGQYSIENNFAQMLRSTGGQIVVESISDSYINVTFNFTAENTEGVQVNVTEGKFSSIIKDAP